MATSSFSTLVLAFPGISSNLTIDFGNTIEIMTEKLEEIAILFGNTILVSNGIEENCLSFSYTHFKEGVIDGNLKTKSRYDSLMIPIHLNITTNIDTNSNFSESLEKDLKTLKSLIASKLTHYIFNSGSINTLKPKGSTFVFDGPIQIFSYLNYTSVDTSELPSPLYMPLELLKKRKSEKLDDILSSMMIKENGELLCTDPKLLENQKGIFKDLLKSLAISLSEGRGIVGVSLPIRIFEARSTIERIVDWWSYLPLYIAKAVKATKLLDRMKIIITLTFSALHASMSQWKPFNPLLGETYEGTFIDGTTIHCEHISHHPPITAFFVKGEKFTFSGSYEYLAKTSKTCNEISFWQEGKGTFTFDDGIKISFNYPAASLKGMMYGERLTHYSGAMVFRCVEKQMKAVISFGVDKSASGWNFGGLRSSKQHDEVHGQIYRYDPANEPQPDKDFKKSMKEAGKLQDCVAPLISITGSYFKSLFFDKIEAWDINCLRPTFATPIDHPLPSDCRFREDLIWLKFGDDKVAQKWKLALEVRQRLEKKLRSEGLAN